MSAVVHSHPVSPDTLTLTEVGYYVFRTEVTDKTAWSWCRKWNVKRIGPRLYAREHVDAGIRRQIAQARRQYTAA